MSGIRPMSLSMNKVLGFIISHNFSASFLDFTSTTFKKYFFSFSDSETVFESLNRSSIISVCIFELLAIIMHVIICSGFVQMKIFNIYFLL